MDSRDVFDAETVDDALDVLQDLVLWELPPEHWTQVEVLLDQIVTALAAQDADSFREVVAALELSGPVRATLIGSAKSRSIPEPVLDRRNNLVHSLGTQQRTSTTTTESGRGDKPAR